MTQGGYGLAKATIVYNPHSIRSIEVETISSIYITTLHHTQIHIPIIYNGFLWYVVLDSLER
jgi:hypothetical protein